MSNLYKNKKNGKIYKVTNMVTNATNAQDGQMMFLYHEVNDSKQIYVRKIEEFMEKFDIVLPEIKMTYEKIEPTIKKMEFGRWPVCSKCGNTVFRNSNNVKVEFQCRNRCSDAKTMSLRQYHEEILKKPFVEEEWSWGNEKDITNIESLENDNT